MIVYAKKWGWWMALCDRCHDVIGQFPSEEMAWEVVGDMDLIDEDAGSHKCLQCAKKKQATFSEN